MKKKRLSMFSLLIALTLTLGACDDLEDRYPTGSDSDESTEVAGDEDPSSGVNPNEDEDPNAGVNPNENENEGNNPSSNKDVTITLSTTSITVKENETAYFSVSLSDSEASILTVSPENATYIEVGPSGSGSEYYVKGLEAGSTSITITAGGEGFNTASATLPVTITPADVYTYKMIISNASDVPTTGWVHNSTDVSFTFAPKLETYKNGTLESTTDLSASDVTISASNEEETASEIIAVTGLTISPAGKAGTVTVTASYTGELTVSDSYTYTVTVDETFSSVHTLKIDTTNVPESETVGEGGFDIVANLTTATTADSWGTTETSSALATESDVTISVCPSDAMNVAGLHVVPTANVTEETNVTITVVWAAYSEEETASDSISLTIYPKDSATYSMEITNASDFTGSWYTEDDAKTISLSITSSEESEEIDVDQLISDGKITARAMTENVVSIEGLTVTPVAKGTTTIYVVWTEHTEANASISVTVLEHSYKLSITNKDELAADWSIEDGSRSLSIELSSDRDDITKEATTSNVHITYDTSAFTTSDDGFTLTPVQTGTYTITATWVDDNLAIGAEGVDSFTVTVNDTVKVTELTLSQSSISWDAPNSTTLTATLKGKDDATPTNQGVSWSVSGDSSIALDAETGLSVTVTASAYNASATITATSDENPDASATCVVSVGEAPIVPATYVSQTYSDEIISEPDNNGVYVIGASNNMSYIGDSGIVSTYNEAVAIRTIEIDSGTYALKVGDKYIDSSLSASDSTPAQTFTISDSGIMLDGSQLYISESGLTTTSTDTPAYILDEISLTTTPETTGDDNAFYLGYQSGGVYYYVNEYDSNRFKTTTDPSEAFVFSLESAGENLYYLSYDNSGSKTYVYGSSSSNNISTSTTKGTHTVLYDNGVWYSESGEGHALMYYASNSNIGFYTSSNLGSTNNIAVTLIGISEEEDLAVKGISISANESYLEGYGIAPSLATYPSGVNALSETEVTWSFESSDGGTLIISGSNITAGNPGTVTLIATYGDNISDSCTIIIESSAGHEPEETLLGTYDFESNTVSDSNAPGASDILSFMNTYYTVNASANPLNDVPTADSVLRGTGSTSTDLRSDQGCMRIGTSSKAGELVLDFGETEITKIVVRACGMAGSGNNYTLTVNTSTVLTMSQSTANLTSRTEVNQYNVEFSSGVTTIDMVSNANAQGTTGYRILIYDIEIYAML